jgi:hypothetical protein
VRSGSWNWRSTRRRELEVAFLGFGDTGLIAEIPDMKSCDHQWAILGGGEICVITKLLLVIRLMKQAESNVGCRSTS